MATQQTKTTTTTTTTCGTAAKSSSSPSQHQSSSLPPSVSFLQNLLLGGISGTVAKTATAPLERVKLLLQVQDVSSQMVGVRKYNGFYDCIKRVYHEQGLSSLWRGNTSNVVRYFPTQALNFAFKDNYQKWFVRHTKEEDFWKFFGGMLAAGGAAGATSLAFVYPLDFARTRLGADVGKGGQREFRGFADCCTKIYRQNGFRGLYKGFVPSVAGIVVYRAAFFGLYDTIKSVIYTNMSMKSNPLINFAVGFGVETAAGLVAYPFDTVRRRLMMQGGKNKVVYKGSFDCCRKMIANEGVSAFYKGCFSNVLRGVGGAIVLVMYDEMKKILDAQNEKNTEDNQETAPQQKSVASK